MRIAVRLSGILLAAAAVILIAVDIIYVRRLDLALALAAIHPSGVLEFALVMLLMAGVVFFLYWWQQERKYAEPVLQAPSRLASFLCRNPIALILLAQTGLVATLLLLVSESFGIVAPSVRSGWLALVLLA